MEGHRQRSLVATLAGIVALGALGVGIATAGEGPIDLLIAKQKSGPYKSNGLFTSQPDANPQVQKRTIEPGKAAKFFIKMKNPNPGDIGDYIGGDPGTSDFDVTYKLDGENITDEMTPNCQFRIPPANGSLLIQMRVKATGAVPGDSDYFAAYLADNTLCQGLDELVWAKVRVK